ncbi:hypothetical protein DFJ73DRAFT_139016 [Zopfochytrium polystomum]|nr:hypothetical protein DFJ73DRAFT_139016 [Zopfochytrium polystomum]
MHLFGVSPHRRSHRQFLADRLFKQSADPFPSLSDSLMYLSSTPGFLCYGQPLPMSKVSPWSRVVVRTRLIGSGANQACVSKGWFLYHFGNTLLPLDAQICIPLMDLRLVECQISCQGPLSKSSSEQPAIGLITGETAVLYIWERETHQDTQFWNMPSIAFGPAYQCLDGLIRKFMHTSKIPPSGLLITGPSGSGLSSSYRFSSHRFQILWRTKRENAHDRADLCEV